MPERRANIPDFRLSVDGVDFTDKARPRLVSLSITEKRGGEADEIDLVLDDSDGRLALPKKGALIRVQLGWRQGSDVTLGLVDKGRFTADEVSWSGPPDQVSIRGRSADLTAGFRQRKEAVHKATTLGALAKKIAGAHGLEAKVAPELAGIAVPVIEQHGKSDMALLRRLGREHDAVATVKNRKLILSPIGSGKSPGGKALPRVTFSPIAGDRYSYREIDRSGEAGAEARYHDADTGVRKTVKEGGAGKGTPQRIRKVYHSKAAATAAAKAAAKRSARMQAEFDMTLALGRADVAPEQPAALTGFKQQIDARRWIIAEVRHQLDRSAGFTTSIKCETK
ncbi:MAG: phage late control D family protein [Sphingomonas sp.]|nr:phage late control D family protein [Sphingomonas sp.]